MISFKVILICFASLSTVQAIGSCAPKTFTKIDKNGAYCDNDCTATVVFSGLRTGAAQFVTIDMIVDHYEPDTFMTLTFVTNKDYNLNCTTKTVYRNKKADGLHCSWKLRLSHIQKIQVTNQTILTDLVVNPNIQNYIYFGINGHKSLIDSSLVSFVQYNDLFPDCTEYDVLTFYDPKKLNKITLSKQKDSITVFVHSMRNDANVNRAVIFTNSGLDQFHFECKNDFNFGGMYITRYGMSDYSTDLLLTNWQGYPSIGKCAITLPLKIHTTEYGWEFDFIKKPLNMIFNTTQPGASFTQRNIKFNY